LTQVVVGGLILISKPKHTVECGDTPAMVQGRCGVA